MNATSSNPSDGAKPRAKTLERKAPAYRVEQTDVGSLIIFTDESLPVVRYPPTEKIETLRRVLDGCARIRRRINCVITGRELRGLKNDYELVFPNTVHGKAKLGIHPSCSLAPSRAPCFAAAAAKEIGVSRSQIDKWIAIGELPEKETEPLVGTGLENQPFFVGFYAEAKNADLRPTLLEALKEDGPAGFKKAVNKVLLERQRCFAGNKDIREEVLRVGDVISIGQADCQILLEVVSIAPEHPPAVRIKFTAPHARPIDVEQHTEAFDQAFAKLMGVEVKEPEELAPPPGTPTLDDV